MHINITIPPAFTDMRTLIGRCPLTRRSFTGTCMLLAGSVIAYKTRLQPTPALSSTEAEFMAACDAGKICLFVRSIMHDLGIPQDAASVIYEDNEGAIAMANAQKPTTRTRHMDIRYFAMSTGSSATS